MTSPTKAKKSNDWLRDSVASTLGSLISTALLFPLETVRTRIQSYPDKYEGIKHCFKSIYRYEGMRSFYNGLPPPLCAVATTRVSSMVVYQQSMEALRRNQKMDSTEFFNRKGSMPTWELAACSAASGALAGAIMVPLASPLEFLTKTAQVANVVGTEEHLSAKSHKYASQFKGMNWHQIGRVIYTQRGLSGIFLGFRFHLLRDIIGTSAFFTSYETSKLAYAAWTGQRPSDKAPIAMAGAVSGLASWLACYPIDTVKTILQKNALLASKGQEIRAPPKINFFNRQQYRGLIISLTRTTLVNLIFFSVYEEAKKQVGL